MRSYSAGGTGFLANDRPRWCARSSCTSASRSASPVATMFSTWVSDPDGPRPASASFGECETNPLNVITPGTVCRGLPDVSALSGDVIGNGYTVVTDMVPGTSGPLWLGMWTRIQAAAPDQAHGLGFAGGASMQVATLNLTVDAGPRPSPCPFRSPRRRCRSWERPRPRLPPRRLRG
jgi:hypothetical protein